MKPKYSSSLRNTLAGASLITAITICMTGASSGADTFWTGTTSTAWNTPTNWNTNLVPAGVNTFVNITPANIATISANISATPVDILVGQGGGTNGRLIHNAGTATTGDNNWLIIARGGGTGRYDLSNADGSIGSGSMTVGNNGGGGRLYVGTDTGSTGIVNVNTTGTLITRNDLVIGENGNGTFNLTAGTVTNGGWNFIGRDGSGVGNFTQTGGSLTNTGRTYIGSGTGIGNVIISGGIHNANAEVSFGSGNLTASLPSTLALSGTGTFNTGKCAIGGNALEEATGKATATISGTAALNVNGELWIGQGTGSVGTLTMTGGAITVNNWLDIGRLGGTGTLTMSNGSITKSGGGNFSVGDTGPGTFTMTGGLVNVTGGAFWAGNNNTSITDVSGTAEIRTSSFTVAAAGGTSTVGLDGGTLKAGQIIGGSGTAEVDFNGTQIIATVTQPAFISNLDVAKIEAGGLKIDSAGFNLTSGQVLSGTVGDLTKSGAGTLKLTAVSNYSGNNIVNGGKLYSNNKMTGTGNLTVANGAGFGIVSLDDFSQLTGGSATFGTSAATTLDFDLGNFSGNPFAAPLKVTNLTANGVVTINIADASPDATVCPLIEYTSKTLNGSGSFVLGTLPPGVVATLQDTGTAINLVVSSIALPRWDGADISGGIWDINTTTNWIDRVSGFPSKYKEGNPVLFDDNLSGTPNVVLNTTVNPAQVAFSSGLANYTLNGTGAIAGATGLTKSGGGSLTLGTINSYTGVTELDGGVTNVSTALTNGGVASAIGAASAAPGNLVFGGGTLNYTGPAATINRGFTVSSALEPTASALSTANNLTVTGQVTTGTFGRFTKLGAGTLTINNALTNVLATASNAIPGSYRVDEGSLVLTGGGTFSSTGEFWVGSTTTTPASLVINGATLTTNTWLSIGRGNGTTGLLSTATFTNATVTTGNVSLGYDAGVASHLATSTLTLTNSTFNTGVANIGESGGSTATTTLNGASSMTSGDTNIGINNTANGTLLINGTSTYTSNNRLLIGNNTGATGTVIISNSGTLNKPGGFLSIGSNGTGTLTVKDSGKVTSAGAFNVGDVGTSSGTLSVEGGGSVIVTGNVFVGKNGTTGALNMSGTSTMTSVQTNIAGDSGSHGTMDLTGSSVFTSSDRLQVGPGAGSVGSVIIENSAKLVVNSFVSVGYNGGGTMTIKNNGTFTNNDDFSVNENGDIPAIVTVQDSGTLSAEGTLWVGRNAGRVGTLNISGTATVSTTGAGGMVVTSGGGAVGTVNLDGGKLAVRKVSDGGGTSTFNFNGGVLQAGSGANAAFMGGLDNVNVKAGGALIDSNGNNIIVNAALLDGGTGGGLTKSGAGTLTITVAATYTGETKVNAGTLEATNASVFSDTAALRLATGTTLTLTHAGTDTVGSLYLAGSPVAAGIWGAPGSGAANTSSFISGTGLLNVSTSGSSSPYDTWIGTYFPGETNQAIIGFAADPDKDGSSNALEFALGGSPNSGSNNPKVYSIIGDSSDVGTAKELLLTIAVRTGTPAFLGSPSPSATLDGITCTVQGTLDLGTFTSAVSVVTPVITGLPPSAPAGYEYRTFSLDVSNGVANKGFLRARVTTTP